MVLCEGVITIKIMIEGGESANSSEFVVLRCIFRVIVWARYFATANDRCRPIDLYKQRRDSPWHLRVTCRASRFLGVQSNDSDYYPVRYSSQRARQPAREGARHLKTTETPKKASGHPSRNDKARQPASEATGMDVRKRGWM